MFISIILPTLNEADNLRRLLPYLQTNAEGYSFEMIVVDAMSSDDTVAVATQLGARVILCQRRNRAVQMNAGARAALGDVLYFVHADTIPPPCFAADINAEIAAGTIMGCYRYRFDSPSRLLRFNAYFTRFPFLWCQGGDKTFFIRRCAFEAMGGYDERFVIMEEYDFLRRAMKRYPLRILAGQVVVSARKYDQNSWLRVQLANAGAFLLFRLRVDPVLIKRFYYACLRHPKANVKTDAAAEVR
ncbi:MAG: TIGR04283 family arsenosugar biosynthesis glycosyltransferase [Saprospiraceae bacterium]|nr:TIGR04283 family arsenosugar biosynthesis glycosyltransferase [Saprospiraceae bacterium]MDW8484467.1 TIGR04283 family arsenosugar biosynthesis glycosyltransferase [Saprospiraceae bacterium]